MNNAIVDSGKTADSFLTRRFPGLIFIATRAAGEENTAIAQLIEHELSEKGVEIDLVSLGLFGSQSASMLKRVLNRTEDVEIGASGAAMAEDPFLALKLFDHISDRMVRGGALIDFGPGTAGLFAAWAPECGIREFYGERPLPPVTLVVPVTANGASVQGALETIADARNALKNVPVGNVVVVYDERDGEFSSSIPGHDALKALESDTAMEFTVTSFALPELRSEISRKLRSTSTSFREALNVSAPKLATKLDLAIPQCSRGKRFLREWVAKASADLEIALAA